MSDNNAVWLSGNLTRDAELSVTKSGKQVCKFGIAVGERKSKEDTKTHFFDCIIWGNYGEAMQRYLRKGQKVALIGRLNYSSWSDPKTGYKRSKVEIYVSNIDTMGPPPARDASEYASGQQIPLAAAPPQVPAPDLYDEDIPFD